MKLPEAIPLPAAVLILGMLALGPIVEIASVPRVPPPAVFGPTATPTVTPNTYATAAACALSYYPDVPPRGECQ